MSDRPGALLLGGGFSELATARSLAAHGIEVVVVGDRFAVARFSRAVRRFEVLPPGVGETELPAFLAGLARQPDYRGRVLFAGQDEHVRAIARERESLSACYTLACPAWEPARHFLDKRLTLRLAEQAGVPVPASQAVDDPADLAKVTLPYPLVVKPAAGETFRRRLNLKAMRADSPDELRQCVAGILRDLGPTPLLVQECLPNPGENLYSFAGYFRDGRPVAALAVKRRRQYPRDFGRASSFVEVVEQPELAGLAQALLDTVSYTGLAEVEFMWDPRAACFKLLEVNTRFWAWHALAIAAGLDLPFIAYCEALGRPWPRGQAQVGWRWMRMHTDVRAAILELLAGRLAPRDYLAGFGARTAPSIASRSDPWPGLLEPFLRLAARVWRPPKPGARPVGSGRLP